MTTLKWFKIINWVFAIALLVLTLITVVSLHAEDAKPLATVEELTQKVADQNKQIAEQAAELRLYQQGMFQCQAAEIHQQAVGQAKAQIDAQAKQSRTMKPEAKK